MVVPRRSPLRPDGRGSFRIRRRRGADDHAGATDEIRDRERWPSLAPAPRTAHRCPRPGRASSRRSAPRAAGWRRPPPAVSEPSESYFVGEMIRAGDSLVLVAEGDGEVVGNALVSDRAHSASATTSGPSRSRSLDGLARRGHRLRAHVAPPRTGRASSGLAKLALGVFPDNDRAIAVYEHAGFEREGLRRRQYRGVRWRLPRRGTDGLVPRRGRRAMTDSRADRGTLASTPGPTSTTATGPATRRSCSRRSGRGSPCPSGRASWTLAPAPDARAWPWRRWAGG